MSLLYNHSSLFLIAAATVSRSLSSISVLVSLTALPRMTRQISISFSPSSSFSGILATASEITFDARGRRNENMILKATPSYIGILIVDSVFYRFYLLLVMGLQTWVSYYLLFLYHHDVLTANQSETQYRLDLDLFLFDWVWELDLDL